MTALTWRLLLGLDAATANRAEGYHNTFTTQLAYQGLLAEMSAESRRLAAMLPPELWPAAGSKCGLGPSSTSAGLRPRAHSLDCYRVSDIDCGTGLRRVA